MSYFKRIFSVIVLFFIISQFLYYFIEKGIYKYDSNSYLKFDQMFNYSDENYDIVLIGNSRVHRNIDVKVLESITKKKTYNAGISGANGYEISVALKGFIKCHQKTKIVILNIDKGLLGNKNSFFNPTLYINSFNNDVIYNEFNKNGYPVLLYKWLPFTRVLEFNDDMRKNVITALSSSQKKTVEVENGYLRMNENIGKFDTIYSDVELLNLTKPNFIYLEDIVSFCNKAKLKLVFIESSGYNQHYYKKHPNYNTFIDYIKSSYSQKQNIPFFILDTIKMNYNVNHFSDNIHLNVIGTKLYSEKLGSLIYDSILHKHQDLN